MGYERLGVGGRERLLSKSQELSGVNDFTRRQEKLRESRSTIRELKKEHCPLLYICSQRSGSTATAVRIPVQ